MKKIRLKFFLISAISLFVVLFTIIAGLNISNYVNLKNQSFNTSQLILNYVNNDPLPPEGDPEIIFRSRFFISTYVDDKLVAIDTSRVVRVDKNEAIEMSNNIYNSSSENGYLGMYYYLKNFDQTVKRIIFLDQQVELDNYYNVLKMSSIIASIGYFVVLILIYLLSFLIIKPIEEANKKQKRFITDASHELKTPLTIINSNISLIEMENGKSEWIDSTKKQVDRLSEMTNQLVMLSKLNEEDLKLNISEIELEPFISELSKPYIKLLKDKKVILSLELSSLKITADVLLVSNLFNTLLDNMVKYAYEGKAKIILKKNRKNVEIDFINKVDPNSKINVDSLFDRFYKADESRTSKSNSFGIGLSMAEAIMDAHKGKISASLDKNIITFKIIF